MKHILKFLIIFLVAFVVYGGVAFGIQKLLLVKLEESTELQITGKNLTPFSLFSVRFRDLELKRENAFLLQAKEAKIFFSPIETLFGQIPLKIRAQNLLLVTQDATIDSFLSRAPWDSLETRMTVFCRKGVWVKSFDLRGKGMKLQASGKLLRKGKGTSDLTATLSLEPRTIGESLLSLLTQNIFTKSDSPITNDSAKPLTFSFKLRGDITHPDVSFDSAFLSMAITEKAEAP